MINFGLQDPNAFARGMQQGRQPFDEMTATIEKQRADNALRAYASNPQGPGAINALAQVDPRLAIQQQGQMANQAAEKQERDAKLIAGLARDSKDATSFDAAVDQVVSMGYPQAAQFKGKFSPALRTALMAAGGVKDEVQQPTSFQRDYEFLREKNPELADKYLANRAEPQPMIASNGDGTFTVIPRGNQPAGLKQGGGPQPGQVEDGYRFKGGDPADSNNWEPAMGGPTPQASGNFPRP